MWELYQHSKLWGQTPAQLMFIQEEYVAFCLNEAVAYFGVKVTNELEKITGKDSKAVERRRNAKLNQLLGIPDKQRFRQVGGGPKK